ncbi:hypothetical protein KIL84_008201 [Mauremys mutica]|uniref:Uncharacterized protein n=1 Tax=Mauremys mutica TaxID=74926 RepID=A0A9D3X8A3_9SAUR|nr:hypothetical protein KIL84_008201 [Mauremys mutica]
MAAYLQWRRFVFFDREPVKEPAGPDGGKPFALPPGVTVCDSGRGSLVFGDILARAAEGREAGGSPPPPPLNAGGRGRGRGAFPPPWAPARRDEL